jgi:phage terminase large subunit-like protein
VDAIRHRIDLGVLDSLPPQERRKALRLLREHWEGHKSNQLWRFDPLAPSGSNTPHVKQHAWMLAHDADIRVFLGGNRAGKTTAGVVADIIDCCDDSAIPPHLAAYKRWHEPIQMYLVAVDARTMETVQLPKFREWTPSSQLVGNGFDKAYDKTLQRLNFKNGSWVQFMTQRMEVDAFAGASLHRVHFDEEPAHEHGKSLYTEAVTRLIDHGGDMLMTLTPLLGMSWFYDDIYLPWEREKGAHTEQGYALQAVGGGYEKSTFLTKVDMDDNPTLDPRGKAMALAEYHTEEERQARKSGRFVSFSGLVYDGFNRDRHVIPDHEAMKALDPKLLQRLAVGIDPGFRHKAGVIWVARTERALVVVAELGLKETVIGEVAKRIHMKNEELSCAPSMYPGDPACLKRDPQTGKSDQLAFVEAGVPIFPGINDVRPGINVIRGLLERGELLIAASCTELVEEFTRYRWVQPKRSEHAPRDQPVKRDDHLLDALRYAVMSLPRPEITKHADRRPAVERLMEEEMKLLELRRRQAQSNAIV